MVRSKLLALEYIADALLQDGHDFSLADMRVDPQPLEEFCDNMARLYASTTLGWRELVQRVKSSRIPQSSPRRVRNLPRDVTDAQAYLRGAQEPA